MAELLLPTKLHTLSVNVPSESLSELQHGQSRTTISLWGALKLSVEKLDMFLLEVLWLVGRYRSDCMSPNTVLSTAWRPSPFVSEPPSIFKLHHNRPVTSRWISEQWLQASQPVAVQGNRKAATK